MKNNYLIVTLSGPPASGKTVVKNNIGYKHITTVTTRKPRANEVDGKDYHFIQSVEEFHRLHQSGELLEKNYFGGNYYGMFKRTLDSIKNSNDVYAIVCEINGVKFLREYFGKDKVLPIFLDLSIHTIAHRLRDKGRPVADFQQRLTRAEYELSDEYKSFWKEEGLIINNDDAFALEETVNKVRALVHARRMISCQ